MNLLIADDELLIRRGLLSLDWSSIGIEDVFSASSGYEVRDLLLSTPIDLAIFDIKMPGMTGLELAAMIKAYSLDTAVILLTGFSEFEYAREAIHNDVREYILKPIRPREILNTVARVKQELEQERAKIQKLREYGEVLEASDTAAQVRHHFENVSEVTAQILQKLAEEYSQPLSLETLSAEYHFSVPYLSRKIKRETGYSFLDILKAVRLTNAAQLLLQGGKVYQACIRCGFNDQRYFSQVFRGAFGVSPTDFRKKEIDPKELRFHAVLETVSKKRGAAAHED